MNSVSRKPLWVLHSLKGEKRKGKEQVKGPQELSGPLDFTPSKPSQIVGASTFLLGTPINFLDTFQSAQTIPPHPSPIVLPSIQPPRWQYIVFPFSQANIIVEKCYSTKWLEEYDRICAFIHKIIHRQFILAFFLFLSNSLLCFLTRLILLLLIFLGTFPFHWFPIPQRFSYGISKIMITLCPFRLCQQVSGP